MKVVSPSIVIFIGSVFSSLKSVLVCSACTLFLSYVYSPYAGGAFWPVFFIANVAALIASRTMTTATFSCIKQSIALGCFPRLKIVHTSRKFMGQIYIPVMNWFLLVFCLIFFTSFTSINELGNAYGNLTSFFTTHFLSFNWNIESHSLLSFKYIYIYMYI